jgi:hypothetical protein
MRKFLLNILIAVALAVTPTLADAQDYYPAALGDFDGTSDYLYRGAGLAGAADGKVGTFSVWVRLVGGDGAKRGIFSGQSNYVRFDRDNDSKFQFILIDTSPDYALVTKSSSTYTADPVAWIHVLGSWNLATNISWMYINDVDEGNETVNVDALIDYTLTDWKVGGLAGAGDRFFGDISELYFNISQYLDLSIEANRRKFISSTGHPVDLGPACSSPTGTAPIVCMRTQFNNAGLNDGTGGDFVINGAPTYTVGPVPFPLTTWTPGTKRGRGGRGGRSTIQQEMRN